MSLLLALFAAATAAHAQARSVYVTPYPLASACGEALVDAGAAAGPAKDVDTLVPAFALSGALRKNRTRDAVVLMPLDLYMDGAGHPLSAAVEPFAFRDVAHFAAFARSALFEEWSGNLAKVHGVRLLALAFWSQTYVAARKPLAEPGDFAGVSLAGVYGTWFAPLGSKVIPMPEMDMPVAAGKGIVDGAVLPLGMIEALALQRVLRFVHEQPVAISSLGFFLSDAAYASLARTEQERLANAARKAAERCSAALFEKDAKAYGALKAAGVEFVQADTAALAAAVRSGRRAMAARQGWRRTDLERLQAVR